MVVTVVAMAEVTAIREGDRVADMDLFQMAQGVVQAQQEMQVPVW